MPSYPLYTAASGLSFISWRFLPFKLTVSTLYRVSSFRVSKCYKNIRRPRWVIKYKGLECFLLRRVKILRRVRFYYKIITLFWGANVTEKWFIEWFHFKFKFFFSPRGILRPRVGHRVRVRVRLRGGRRAVLRVDLWIVLTFLYFIFVSFFS